MQHVNKKKKFLLKKIKPIKENSMISQKQITNKKNNIYKRKSYDSVQFSRYV